MMGINYLFSTLSVSQTDLENVSRTNRAGQSSERQLPYDYLTPPCEIPVVHIDDKYTLDAIIQQGSEGVVYSATAKYNMLDHEGCEPWVRGSLIQKSRHYDVENLRNKKAGKVAIKKLKVPRESHYISDYLDYWEVGIILNLPYHRNLVQHHELFVDDKNYDLHIVMEHMKQDLFDFIDEGKPLQFTQWELSVLLAQMLSAIRHVHKSGFVHCDIKPENFLISPLHEYYDMNMKAAAGKRIAHKYIVKLSDFGHAKDAKRHKELRASALGTTGFRAPEILLNCENCITPALDIWAFGILACELASKIMLTVCSKEEDELESVIELLGTPFRDNDLEKNGYIPKYGYWDEGAERIKEIKPDYPQEACRDIKEFITDPRLTSLCDVITACIQWNPCERATVDELCRMPFFRGTCVQDDHYDSKL